MWLTKKILVATDFAEPSKAAANVGLELAQTFRVPLALVHAYVVPLAVYTGVPFIPVSDYVRAFEDAARELLEKERARLVEKGVEVTAVLRAGVAWEEILSAAKELDAGLIVTGTHGRHGLPRAVLGSVAEKVVRHAPVPVLTIHADPALRNANEG
jgi:nucleotide-binding universal stress UspA family protein